MTVTEEAWREKIRCSNQGTRQGRRGISEEGEVGWKEGGVELDGCKDARGAPEQLIGQLEESSYRKRKG